jgi:two-component system LytT family response regulator
MKLKALIVDDEKDVALALRLLLEKTCAQVKVIGIAVSLDEAIKTLNREEADILFLDIEMPGGTGFDLLRLVDGKEIYTIFTTAYSEYAIRAIKQGARDYLLKPMDPDELITSIEKAQEHFNRQHKEVSPSKASPTLTVTTSAGIVFLNKEDILYIRADGRYSELHCRDEQQYNACKNLGEYEGELSKDFFFRVHKSYLINCRHVLKINSGDGGFVEMSNHKEIELSKRRKTEFLRFLK